MDGVQHASRNHTPPQNNQHPVCAEGHYQQPCNHLPGCNTAKTHHNTPGRQLPICPNMLGNFQMIQIKFYWRNNFSTTFRKVSSGLWNNLSRELKLLITSQSSLNFVISSLINFGLLFMVSFYDFSPCFYSSLRFYYLSHNVFPV